WAFRFGAICHPAFGLLVSPPVANYYKTQPLRTETLRTWFIGKTDSGIQGSGNMSDPNNPVSVLVPGTNFDSSLSFMINTSTGSSDPNQVSIANAGQDGPQAQQTNTADGIALYKSFTRQNDQASFGSLTQRLQASIAETGVIGPGIGSGSNAQFVSDNVFNSWFNLPAAQNQYKYFLEFSSTGDGTWSPAVLATELILRPGSQNITGLTQGGNIQVGATDVVSVVVRQTVESTSATVTLNNRQRNINNRSQGGVYTFDKGFIGVKPIEISVTQPYIQGGSSPISFDTSTLFRGFITTRTPTRQGGAPAFMEWACEDVSLRLKSVRGFNMPVFDGYCHLAAMYWLLSEAGYTDSQMMFWQNPTNENDQITLPSILTGIGNDLNNLTGPCFEGHVTGWDGIPDQMGIPARIVHACLENSASFRETPFYMPQMGTPLWDIAQDISSRFSGWFLYGNAYGNM
ncbi:MAG TPA: hypothetical protein VNX68_17635, partial [Nitrosopumilaceae archaeon]|nr:hypothetical protein [Nitrosopumilaceae archaeon]